MPLPVPVIDERDYQEILEEAIARIDVHTPEWTNHNESDPGITLLQLFAFMTESMLYRANRMPERVRRKFLRLLDIPLQPASAAQGLVTFTNTRGAFTTYTLNANGELLAGQVPFRTNHGLTVLPVEAHVYYKGEPDLPEDERREAEAVYRQLYASYAEGDLSTLDLYETRRLEPSVSEAGPAPLNLEADTNDGYLWLALLARAPEEVEEARLLLAGETLTLGIVSGSSNAGRVLPAGGEMPERRTAALRFTRPVVEPTAEAPEAAYEVLEARERGNVLSKPGTIELLLPEHDPADPRTWLTTWQNFDPLEAGVGAFPPAIEETSVADRLITWIRVEGTSPEGVPADQLDIRIVYLGINAARVVQKARVTAEFLGEGTGQPDQEVTVANTPVLPKSLVLSVNGQVWERVDDLTGAAAEAEHRYEASEQASGPARVYTLDPAAGHIRFGGLRGRRPPAGAVIQASYAYGGGLEGMVSAGAITKGPQLPAGITVANPVKTWGGSEPETVQTAERRMAQIIRHRNRMVTAPDMEDIVWSTPGVNIGRVEVRPLLHPNIPDVEVPGVVTVLVLPAYDRRQPDAPRPERLFLDVVCRHLDPRRLITTELYVRGPVYKPVVVSAGIEVRPTQSVAVVRENVQQKLRDFLSPLYGGFEDEGWPLNRDVDRQELLAAAARAEGVAKVNEVRLSTEGTTDRATVPIAGLELPRLVKATVQVGSALPPPPPPPPDDTPPQVPVPIVPREC